MPMRLKIPVPSVAAALSGAALLSGCGGGPEVAPKEEPASSTTRPAPEAATQTVKPTSAAPVIELEQGPIVADNAKQAMELLDARDKKRRQLVYQTGQAIAVQRTILSWPYETCRDAGSLIPPPLEGWGVFSDISIGEWPITPEMARIAYSYADDTLDPASAEYGASKHNVSVNISSGTIGVEGMRDMYTEPALRGAMLMPGPYNYPIQKTPPDYPGRTVLLGDYLVQLDGTGRDIDAYFSMIIACGIAGGLVTEGVDQSALRAAP